MMWNLMCCYSFSRKTDLKSQQEASRSIAFNSSSKLRTRHSSKQPVNVGFHCRLLSFKCLFECLLPEAMAFPHYSALLLLTIHLLLLQLPANVNYSWQFVIFVWHWDFLFGLSLRPGDSKCQSWLKGALIITTMQIPPAHSNVVT